MFNIKFNIKVYIFTREVHLREALEKPRFLIILAYLLQWKEMNPGHLIASKSSQRAWWPFAILQSQLHLFPPISWAIFSV